MMRIGCTGHQKLSFSTRRNVAAAIAGVLADQNEDLVGVTSLAEGADQLFAFAILAAGGQLYAIIPSSSYERSFLSQHARDTYAALVSLSTEKTILPFPEPGEDAYLAAGREVADRSDILVAVWDGQQAAGKGGTGDIVGYARAQGVDVRVVWPSGAAQRN